MKNPIKKKTVHQLNAELSGMQTVTTITLFGIPIYRTRKKRNVSVSLF
jgi:hypothetical protein